MPLENYCCRSNKLAGLNVSPSPRVHPPLSCVPLTNCFVTEWRMETNALTTLQSCVGPLELMHLASVSICRCAVCVHRLQCRLCCSEMFCKQMQFGHAARNERPVCAALCPCCVSTLPSVSFAFNVFIDLMAVHMSPICVVCFARAPKETLAINEKCGADMEKCHCVPNAINEFVEWPDWLPSLYNG